MRPEPAAISFQIDGKPAAARTGASVAAALLGAGITTFRKSSTGEPRGPLCGMGICFECRLTIDGRPHQKSCQIPVMPGMEVRTDD